MMSSSNAAVVVDYSIENASHPLNYIILNNRESLKKQINTANTVYEIKDVFNLQGQTVEIPEGCILRFSGGGFTGGTLMGNSTQIQCGAANIFSTSLCLTGTWDINRIDVRWFGALGDISEDSKIVKDDAAAINHAIRLSQGISQWGHSVPVYLAPATYKIASPINVIYSTQLIGDNPGMSLSMPTVRILRYGTTKGNDNENWAVRIEDQALLKNVYIKCMTGSNAMDGINITGTAGICIDNVSIVNTHYGINKTFKKYGAGFSSSQLNNIRINNCVRGISVNDDGSLPRVKNKIVSWMNHVYISKIDISNVYECGLYLDVISLFDANNIDGLSISNVGYGDYYPGNYFKKYSDKFIAGIYASVYDDNNIGQLSIQKGYLENIYCTDKFAGKPVKGKYLLESYDYDNNPCICVNNINLVVRDSHFQNTLTLIRSLGKDNILVESCTDGEYYRGPNDSQRLYLCCENPQTTLWIKSFNIHGQIKKDCIKKNILSESIKSLKLENIDCSNGSVQLEDIDLHYLNKQFISGEAQVYLSEHCSGSGVWQTYPMNINDIPDEIKYKGRLVFIHAVKKDNGYKTISSKEIVNSLK